MKFAIGIMIGLILLSVLRILIGPTVWDRLLGLNLLTSKVVMFLVLLAYLLDETYIIDFAMIYALLGFIGVMFIAINFQRRGKI